MKKRPEFGSDAVTTIIRAMISAIPKSVKATEDYRAEFNNRYQLIYRISGGLLLATRIKYADNKKDFTVSLVLRTDSRRLKRIKQKSTVDKHLQREAPESKVLVKMSINHRLENKTIFYKRSQRGTGTWGNDYSLAKAWALVDRLQKAGDVAAKRVLDYDFEQHLAKCKGLLPEA